MKKLKEIINKNKYFALNSIICIFYLEGLGSRGFFGMSDWIMNQAIFFILNIVIVFTVFMLLKNIFNNIISYITINFFVIILGLINYNKYSMQLSVFLPKDITMIDELIGISETLFSKLLFLKIGLGIFLFIIISAYIIKKSKQNISEMNLNFKKTSISILIIFLIFTVSHSNSYSESGYLFYFIKNIITMNTELDTSDEELDLKAEMLQNYLENISDSEEKEDNKTVTVEEKIEKSITPNIIIVMNEAFWNPKLLKKLEFSKNPISNFERLAKDSLSGYLIAPVYGGATANSEFQVLTGINNRMFDSSLIMYNGCFKGPMMSLASTLRTQGYNTTAVHPNVNWYYQRMDNYKEFGFNSFYAKEYMHNISKKGYYIGDEYTNERIIETIESTEERDFIYAITMQNHGPYGHDRYSNYDIKVVNENVSSAEMILNSYVQGVYDADTSLKELTDYLNNIDEETIVVFFGDHLPYLGEHSSIYGKYGFETDSLLKPIEKQNMMYTVPFLIWSNYDTGNSKKNIPLMNMNYLGPKVLEIADLKMPDYYKFLLNMKDKYPVIWDDYALDSNYKIVTDEDVYKKEYDVYYDYKKIVFNNYLKEGDRDFNISENKDYNIRYNKIRVNKVQKMENTLIIKADNFYENMALFINDEEVNYEVINKNEIHIKNFTSDLDQVSLDLLLKDEKGTIIAEWNNSLSEN